MRKYIVIGAPKDEVVEKIVSLGALSKDSGVHYPGTVMVWQEEGGKYVWRAFVAELAVLYGENAIRYLDDLGFESREGTEVMFQPCAATSWEWFLAEAGQLFAKCGFHVRKDD